MEQVKIGIIGVGNMGRTHAKNIVEGKCPELKLAAAADVNPERLQWIHKELDPEVALFSTAEELLDSGLVDAVIVAVPHYDHPKYAMECFRRGLHVMVEKPAGVYTKQVREMNEAAKGAGVKFGMMFNQRTNPVFRKMRELVQSGNFGQIKRTNWIVTSWYRPQFYYDSGDWRATWKGEGGGVLLNQCPHNLDLWQWICGMPVKLRSQMYFGKWHDIEVEDDVTTFVEYANGATGVFVTSTGDTPGTNRFEITLERAKLIAEGGKLTLWELEMSEPEYSKISKDIFGKPKAEQISVELETPPENKLGHVGVLNAFAAAILRDEPMIAGGEEGIRGLTLSNAMHLSAFLGREVEIPFDEELFYEELQKRVRTSRVKTNVVSAVADTSGSYNAK